MLKFHLTAKSQNRKLGPIPASTSSRETCPASCPFAKQNGGGCFADGGPQAIHWAAVTAGKRGDDYFTFLDKIAALPKGQLWRMNVSGDLQNPNSVLGRRALVQLTEANRGKRGFTYSHHPLKPAVVQAFKAATANGFTVNASCQSETEADAAVANGLRAVMVVRKAESRRFWQSQGGNKVVVCPAAYREGQNCKTCQLCHARPQDVIIAFPAHGASYRKAEQALG